ncbi:MAG: hypothetical protein WDN10_01360 [bacterium]
MRPLSNQEARLFEAYGLDATLYLRNAPPKVRDAMRKADAMGYVTDSVRSSAQKGTDWPLVFVIAHGNDPIARLVGIFNRRSRRALEEHEWALAVRSFAEEALAAREKELQKRAQAPAAGIVISAFIALYVVPAVWAPSREAIDGLIRLAIAETGGLMTLVGALVLFGVLLWGLDRLRTAALSHFYKKYRAQDPDVRAVSTILSSSS